MQIGVATVESSMQFPQKIKSASAFWPKDPTFGDISEGTQNTNLKEHKHPYVHWNIIYNRQHMEAAQASISRGVDKISRGNLHNGIPLSCKKKKEEENCILCDSMDGTGEYYTKWNKSVRERQILYDFTYM